MPKGIKGFQKGHSTSLETRRKISEALKRSVIATIIANLVGACIFYFVDKRIFRGKA